MNRGEQFQVLEQFEFKIDPTKNPKEITLKRTDPPDRHDPDFDAESDQSQRGIYELTEASLRIQLANPTRPRPTDFAKDKSDLPHGQSLLELERH
jgi:uncharacterized protein (TIGR03067 family)